MNAFRIILMIMAALLLSTPTVYAAEEGHFQEDDEWIADECGWVWSSSGEFTAYLEDDGVGNDDRSDDGIYKSSVEINFSDEDLDSMACVGSEVEIHFLIGGFVLDDEAKDHIQGNSDITSSTLPGGRQLETEFDNNLNEITLRFGRVSVDELEAGIAYDALLEFWGLEVDDNDHDNDDPWVSIRIGMVTPDGTIPWVLTRGYLERTLSFYNGSDPISFGGE